MPLTEKRSVLLMIGACLMLLAGCDGAGQRNIRNYKIRNLDAPRGAITRVELVHLTNAPGSRLVIYACEPGEKEEEYSRLELSSDEAKDVSSAYKVRLEFRNEVEPRTYEVHVVNPAAR